MPIWRRYIGELLLGRRARLVHVTKGKTVRAESLESEGAWLMVTLQGGGVVGVFADNEDLVLEDLFPDSEEVGSELNVMTSCHFLPRNGRIERSRSNPERRYNR